MSFLFIDEDGNGAIDPQELKHCFHKLEINFTEEDINDLFKACDIHDAMGMKFNEFIVLLCLVCLLKDDPTALHAVSKIPYHAWICIFPLSHINSLFFELAFYCFILFTKSIILILVY